MTTPAIPGPPWTHRAPHDIHTTGIWVDDPASLAGTGTPAITWRTPITPGVTPDVDVQSTARITTHDDGSVQLDHTDPVVVLGQSWHLTPDAALDLARSLVQAHRVATGDNGYSIARVHFAPDWQRLDPITAAAAVDAARRGRDPEWLAHARAAEAHPLNLGAETTDERRARESRDLGPVPSLGSKPDAAGRARYLAAFARVAPTSPGAVNAHRCNDRCLCPVHAAPMIYARVSGDHACQDPDCRYGQGVRALLGLDQDRSVERCPTCQGPRDVPAALTMSATGLTACADTFHREHAGDAVEREHFACGGDPECRDGSHAITTESAVATEAGGSLVGLHPDPLDEVEAALDMLDDREPDRREPRAGDRHPGVFPLAPADCDHATDTRHVVDGYRKLCGGCGTDVTAASGYGTDEDEAALEDGQP